MKQIAKEDLPSMIERSEDKLAKSGVVSASDKQLFSKIFIQILNETLELEYEQLKIPNAIFIEAVKTYSQMQVATKVQKEEAKKRRGTFSSVDYSAEILVRKEGLVEWIRSLMAMKNFWMVFALALNLVVLRILFKFGVGYLGHVMNF